MCHDNGWDMLVDVRNSSVKWVMTVAAGLPNSRLIYISAHNCTGAPTDICFRSKYVGFVILITIPSSYFFITAGVV
jgi:hypothetical protein